MSTNFYVGARFVSAFAALVLGAYPPQLLNSRRRPKRRRFRHACFARRQLAQQIVCIRQQHLGHPRNGGSADVSPVFRGQTNCIFPTESDRIQRRVRRKLDVRILLKAVSNTLHGIQVRQVEG